MKVGNTIVFSAIHASLRPAFVDWTAAEVRIVTSVTIALKESHVFCSSTTEKPSSQEAIGSVEPLKWNEMSSERSSFHKLVSESEVPVLVDVYSDNCGPCQAMKPVLADLKERLGEDLRIIKINGYDNIQFMQDFQIQAFPTLMLFHKGKIVWSRMGFTTVSALEKAFRQHAA